MSVEQAERIAQSQVVWAILFILLFGLVISYLIKTSEAREKKLMDFYDASKLASQHREERLLSHLDKTTNKLSDIADSIISIQNEMSRMNDRIENFEKGNDK